MREEGDADGLVGLGLLLALSALVEKWAGAAMLGYEVAMGMPLAPRPGGHGFDGHEFFVVSAWPFVNAPYIHQEVQVVIEGQVKLTDIRPSINAVDVPVPIKSDKRPSGEVQVTFQLLDSSKLFVTEFA